MRVSILIPCFNAERWIAQCIESALAQTWANKEVIVVDDGSTDQSVRIIQRFADRIRWETGANRGANVARNRLLELARGEWLQYLDADDYLLPDKVELQMRFLVARSDVDVVFGPVTLERLNPAGESQREVVPIPEPHDPWVLLARWYLPQTGAVLWRRQAVVDVGGWKEDQPCCQEHELYLRMLMAENQFAYCDHNGAIYRHWGETSLWRGNVPEVHRQRLEIERRAEEFLCGTNQLTPERRHAINMARFETARSMWQYNWRAASEIIDHIYRSEPEFLPSGAAAPPAYRMVFQTLGFRAAERIADLRRYFVTRPAELS